MGREIKFRAWDVSERVIRNWEALTGLMELVDIFSDKGLILMQYTGLKDKNGKEIYEGDIVSYGMDNPAVCQWHQEESRFIFYQKFRSGGGASLNHCGHYLLKGDTYNEVEIIGNIYENADLLTTSDRQQ